MNNLDLEELMDNVLDLTDEQINVFPDYDELIFKKFDVSVEQFDAIASTLMNFTSVSESPVTNTLRQGFVDVENHMFICQQEYIPKNK